MAQNVVKKAPKKFLVAAKRPKINLMSNVLKTEILSGLAAAGPPLGPQLGALGINIANFCKDFNEQTKNFKKGISLPCRITVNPDRSYMLDLYHPKLTYYVKQAAGIEKGTRLGVGSGEIVGKISLKHVYEIAKIKSQDREYQIYDLPEICKKVIGAAKSCGIQVVRDLDPEEYKAFLEERKICNDQQLAEIQAKLESKFLRTG